MRFTGEVWSQPSAQCRADDPFFGGLASQSPVATGPAPIAGALGYCVVRPGAPDEYVMFSTCGDRDIGQSSCENVLSTFSDDAYGEWNDCPGAPLCPEAPVDSCFTARGDDSTRALLKASKEESCDSGRITDQRVDAITVAVEHVE